MGQTYSLTTLSSGSASIDVPELADLSYEKSLGTARFMKSIRARHVLGLVFVKAFVKAYPSMDLQSEVRRILEERGALADIPNALGYQRVVETGTNGYLGRQFIHSSVYDRMRLVVFCFLGLAGSDFCSTRPFLEDIEKKWLSFQLLCAVRDCHAREIFHGDIKTENLLVTSWNWLYLSDFSASFKPTFLPEDNPADFSFYFDTSGRRTCYLAPERFLVADQERSNLGVNWAMDIFSVGCVIAEIFLEAPIFTLSQMFRYRKGEYQPELTHLGKIEDKDIRDMVMHMIQLEPESRYSAEEYLNFWRHKAFPEYFYSFLHQYMGLITDPSSGRTPITSETGNLGEADERIDRIYLDFDKISYFLGYESKGQPPEDRTRNLGFTNRIFPVQLDLPNHRHPASAELKQADDGTLIFLTVVVSSLRSTAKASARVRACDILLAFAERLPDEAKLDRVLPYITMMLNDRSDMVKIAALRALTQLLEMVSVVSPVNAYIFPEYIFPRLQPFISGAGSKPSPLVRATYASCLASLAHSSSRILDMVQALRADGPLPSLAPSAENAWAPESHHSLYDVARIDLLDYFEIHTKALLTDNDASVRRAILGSVSSLCVFFGSTRANDVVLSHLNTYLNDKDWMLKCAFFETVVGVATYIGGMSVEEFILPLMLQAMSDPEEFVVERVIRSLAAMAEIGLFQRSLIWVLIDIMSRYMTHPSIWIREAAVHFVSVSTKYLSAADEHSIVLPLIQPFLKTPITEVSEIQLLDSLKRPLPRNILDMAVLWVNKVEKGIFWSSAAREGTLIDSSAALKPSQRNASLHLSSIAKNDEDDHWLSRLRTLGMTTEDEVKFVALRRYIFRLAGRQTVNDDQSKTDNMLNHVIPLTTVSVTPQTVFFDKKPAAPVPTLNGNGRTNGDSKPHTIADALLDASTTIEDPSARRKKPQPTSRRSKANGVSASLPKQIATGRVRKGSSQLPSPLSSSPGGRLDSRESSAPVSDVERMLQDSRRKQPESTLSPIDGDMPQLRKMSSPRIPHRSSAINLLSMKDNTKAVPETGTNSEHAFGKVDGPFQAQNNDPSPLSMAEDTQVAESHTPGVQADHTYSGNDPNILRLLDAVFTENYPTDLNEFGPVVSPINLRQPIKKVNGQDPDKPWKPEGNLVAIFGEHTGCINRIVVAPDHMFFLTASDDGSVKVWDSMRLEKNLTSRSRQTHRHNPDAKVKCLCFVENTHTFISAATDGSIHVVKVDYQSSGEVTRYGKLSHLRTYQLPESEYALYIDHFRAETQSTLLMVTNKSRIVALDLKTMKELYSLENPVHHGVPMTFCIGPKHNWLLVGTSHGVLDLWDLRFRVLLKAWGLPGATPIYRIHMHPLAALKTSRGKLVMVAGGSGPNSETTVWDIERVQCREVYRCSPPNGTSQAAFAPLTARELAKLYTPYDPDTDPHSPQSKSMLSRFATSTSLDPSPVPNSSSSNSTSTPMDRGIRALAVGTDHVSAYLTTSPTDPKHPTEPSSTADAPHKSAYLLTAGGPDLKLRCWDLTKPETSCIFSGLDILDEGKPRYQNTRPLPDLSYTVEYLPHLHSTQPSSSTAKGAKKPGGRDGNAGTGGSGGSGGGAGRGGAKGSRSTLISLQQQQLLRGHLDAIMDIAVLRVPYGMVVSGDRGGCVYVFH
jgi:phosphoinositide-3-kinase, regulatory subunit 4